MNYLRCILGRHTWTHVGNLPVYSWQMPDGGMISHIGFECERCEKYMEIETKQHIAFYESLRQIEEK